MEALRGLAFVVRGGGWETYAPQIANLEIEEADGGFRVGYDGRIESSDGVLDFRADIVAENERSLVFTVDFKPETEFRTSRTGFVVLHPVEGVAGEACTITHSDGTVEETAFPGLISPFQPFYDIAAMRHRVSPGVWLTCRFRGRRPVGDGGPAQLDRCLLQDLLPPARAALPLHRWRRARRCGRSRRSASRGAPRPWLAPGRAATKRWRSPSAARPGRRCRRSGSALPTWSAIISTTGSTCSRRSGRAISSASATRATLTRQTRSAAGRGLAEALDAEVVLEITVPCERPVADELAQAAEIAAHAGLKRRTPSCRSRRGS